jgi:hypothetical protein
MGILTPGGNCSALPFVISEQPRQRPTHPDGTQSPAVWQFELSGPRHGVVTCQVNLLAF